MTEEYKSLLEKQFRYILDFAADQNRMEVRYFNSGYKCVDREKVVAKTNALLHALCLEYLSDGSFYELLKDFFGVSSCDDAEEIVKSQAVVFIDFTH